ncbi:hypothetical protein TI10_11805 [Photorhabdus luminescens subsp. luminescens]|uniref:Uncharacterized protein n=1 Tax=Photorhabdus luminescens TaxID=29488 RepID=A0A1G5R385_PHOLU|nr:hypothetical protein TI10_11805 [Photorhabdus luminescens subsp. luminescens]SCZ68554.1 hypothetical protein SAMN02982990_02978 [Photorhabdus luminescens]
MLQKLTSFFRAHIIIINENFLLAISASISRIRRVFSHAYIVICRQWDYLLSPIHSLSRVEPMMTGVESRIVKKLTLIAINNIFTDR